MIRYIHAIFFTHLLVILSLLSFARSAVAQSEYDPSKWKETPDGLDVSADPSLAPFKILSGAALLDQYDIYKPAVSKGQDRVRNRRVVERYFDAPINNADLYASNGTKRLPVMGTISRGQRALRQDNAQNSELFAQFKWDEHVIWDTQDPCVFFVEAKGGQTTQEGYGPYYRHYIFQLVVQDGKITQLTELITPFAQGLK